MRLLRSEQTGELVEYAIIYSRLNDEEEWIEIICIDTMHIGWVHRHNGPHSDEPHKISPIKSQNDVQQSFNASYDEVYGAYVDARGRLQK